MLLTLTLAAVLQATPAADTIPGPWRFTGDISGFPLDQVCTFAQTGTALSGNCTSAEGNLVVVTGQVRGDTITFEHDGEYEGEPLTVIYTGALASPKEMRGSILVQPFDVTGYFTARPAPPAEGGAGAP